MVQAVSKAKSKKERSQNKVVVDVADLFAGNALDFICSSPFPRNISTMIVITIRTSSKVQKVIHPSSFLSSAGPADAARTPRGTDRPARGGSEGEHF